MTKKPTTRKLKKPNSAKAKPKPAAKRSAELLPKKLKKLTSRFVEFDGELASEWLALDAKSREKTKTSNRKLTRSNVKTKVQCMLEDAWVTTSQGITIDWNGAVIDGQHTLNAIVDYYNTAVLSLIHI